MMREPYEHHELTKIVWTPFEQNLAHAMTEKSPFPALEFLTTNNRLNIQHRSWVERDSTGLLPWAKVSQAEVLS